MTPAAPPANSLQVALDANAAAYRRAVQASAPGECWDFVVLTAANEKQAQGYRQELALRHRAVGPTSAFFPAIQRSVGVPDPPGRRAGSGGATLGAVQALSREFGLSGDDLRRHRVLLIHSGGASQRLPAYSPLGKIFAPLPLLRPDGQIATLFDHLYLTLAGLPDRLGPGMLVLAGDVFLLFDHRDVSAPAAGVTALSMRVEPELALGHGVYVTDARGGIRHTLQKVPAETMRRRGATDAAGHVLIDTGLLFFDGPSLKTLASLAGAPPSAKKSGGPAARPARKGMHEEFDGQIDLYDDMTAALASGTERGDYLKGGASPEIRRRLWQKLHGLPFQAMRIDGQFLHLGTTLQFRDAMIGRNPSPAAELFQRNVLAHSEWDLPPGRRVYHGVLLADPAGRGRGGTLGEGSVVEHSVLRAPSRVGAGSVVSQVFALSKPIDLGANLLLFQVPVRDPGSGQVGYVQVVCGVEDDFKGRLDEGKCRYLNRPIEEWLARHRVSADDVWPGVPAPSRTLWSARLFAATRRRDAAHLAVTLSDGRPAAAAVAAWRAARRCSMAMMLEQADPASLIEHREVVSAHLQTEELLDLIRGGADRPVESVVGRYTTAAAYRESEHRLDRWAAAPAADAPAAVNQARALWCVAQLLQRPDHPQQGAARQRVEAYAARAFGKVAEASEIGHREIRVADRAPAGPGTKLSAGVEVAASSPVRLDLAGGWSDTPPYCFERGGHVVNVAIDLDGRPPVGATVRTTRDPRLVLESHDLGQRVEVRTIDPRGAVDVRDPFALHKVALRLCGLLPDTHGDVGRHLKSLGAGLHVVTESRVPKGSGLGTSSILAATLLAALHRLLGDRPLRPAELVGQTLLLEQRLSTGGGWQDQVGGIFPGVKSTVTAPGVPQSPRVEQLDLPGDRLAALEGRLVVYYSGQQRLARDILRRVMGRWLGREPAVVELLDGLKQGAAALRTALLRGRWQDAGREIARYWRTKKELYPGSTTPAIDLLLLETRGHYLAAGLAGAGGGGFAYFLCKDPKQAASLRSRLAEHAARPGSLGSVYATQINRTGIRVTRKAARAD